MRWTLHPGYNVQWHVSLYFLSEETGHSRLRTILSNVVVGRLEWNSFTQRETEEPTENTENCEVEICRA